MTADAVILKFGPEVSCTSVSKTGNAAVDAFVSALMTGTNSYQHENATEVSNATSVYGDLASLGAIIGGRGA